MKHLHIKRALIYKIKDSVIGIGIFYAIMVIVTMAFVTGSLRFIINLDGTNGTSSSSFNGFGVAAIIGVFVIGIVSIREDLRLFLQNGTGRQTVFVVESLAAVLISAVLAIGGEILVSIASALVRSYDRIMINDLYHLIYTEGSTRSMTMMTHIESVLIFFVFFICANIAGTFISLVFYRLNKIWTVIVAVGVPLFLIFGLPVLISYFNISFAAPAAFLSSSPWALIAFALLLSLVISLFNWLLLRRAPIKAVVS